MDTKTKILNLAESLTQQRGFGGFSYLDLASEIGIKAASIHYYFKNKEDLAVALVERTRELHTAGFQEMNQTIATPEGRLQAVIEYFQNYTRSKKFCLCGMMAAEIHSVGPRVCTLLDAYFIGVESFLETQFEEMGHPAAKTQATRFLSALEGASLLARLRNDPEILQEVLGEFIEN